MTSTRVCYYVSVDGTYPLSYSINVQRHLSLGVERATLVDLFFDLIPRFNAENGNLRKSPP